MENEKFSGRRVSIYLKSSTERKKKRKKNIPNVKKLRRVLVYLVYLRLES